MRSVRLVCLLVVFGFGCGVDDFLDDTPRPHQRTASTQPRPTAVQCYETFSAFKRAQGNAGKGRHWHHLVNKNPINEAKFGGLKLHCTDNVIPLDSAIHQKISGWYNSIQEESRPRRVREWQADFSFLDQRDYGIKILRRFGGKLPGSWTR